jgi:endonuclease YncB( thermonuclease family)
MVKRRPEWLIKLAALLVMLAACSAAQATEALSLTGKVVRVVDGDTVVFEAQGEDTEFV